MTTQHAANIEQLYADHHAGLLNHLTRLVGNRETAEDLCHDTFVKAMRFWNQHDSQMSVGAWLYRIATNTAYDYLRRCQRIRFTPLPDTHDTHAHPAPTPEARYAHEDIHQALGQLPDTYRLPLVLHVCSGHSLREIATAMGSTDKAVKTRLYRARSRFREVYQEVAA